jgi:predicted SAM-dependent methyltransferase
MALQPLQPLRLLKRSLGTYLHHQRCLKRRPVIIKSYFAANQIRKLQIGAYEHRLTGWLNTDLWPVNPNLIHLDASEMFPFEDHCLDYIFCEHVIEHIPFLTGLFMLKECFRVLKPKGKIRIATPDLNKFLDLFKDDLSLEQKDYANWITTSFVPYASKGDAVFVLNNLFRNWGHEFIYTEEILSQSLEKAGFKNINLFQVGKSDDPQLTNIEVHGKIAKNEQANAYETMVLQAET